MMDPMPIPRDEATESRIKIVPFTSQKKRILLLGDGNNGKTTQARCLLAHIGSNEITCEIREEPSYESSEKFVPDVSIHVANCLPSGIEFDLILEFNGEVPRWDSGNRQLCTDFILADQISSKFTARWLSNLPRKIIINIEGKSIESLHEEILSLLFEKKD